MPPGPQEMRDEALLELINEELKPASVDDITCVRDRVRFSCPPCPMVQSVVLMLDGLIEVKKLSRELRRPHAQRRRRSLSR